MASSLAQADRPLISFTRLVDALQAGEQMRRQRPDRADRLRPVRPAIPASRPAPIRRRALRRQRRRGRPARRWSGHAGRGLRRAARSPASRSAGRGALRMRRLDRRLELERPDAAGLGGARRDARSASRSSAATTARHPARRAAHRRRDASRRASRRASQCSISASRPSASGSSGISSTSVRPMVDRLAGQPPRLRIGQSRPSRCHRRRRSLRARRASAAAAGCASGTSNGMPASLILALARDSRRPIASGLTRKAEAMRIASRPSTVCSISGVCMAASIAGCAHTNSSFSRSSGNSVAVDQGARPPRRQGSGPARPAGGSLRAGARSIERRRATVSSQASGLSGTPSRGQVGRAPR